MVDPMAQAQVEAEIHRLSRRLDRVTEDVAAASTRAAQGEVDYKLGYASAMLAAQGVKGTVPVKEATALLEVDEEFAEWKLADAELRALQETGRNLRAQLDALRSINANVRSVVTNP